MYPYIAQCFEKQTLSYVLDTVRQSEAKSQNSMRLGAYEREPIMMPGASEIRGMKRDAHVADGDVALVSPQS